MTGIGDDETTAKERSEDPKPPRIPKKLKPFMWIFAVLAVCCLGATVSIVQLLSDQSNDEDGNANLAGCGTNTTIDPNADVPSIGDYSSEQIGNAAIIIYGRTGPRDPGRADGSSRWRPRCRNRG